jgi:hypothetical protein
VALRARGEARAGGRRSRRLRAPAHARARASRPAVDSRAFKFATARFSYKYIDRTGGHVDYRVYERYETNAAAGFEPSFSRRRSAAQSEPAGAAVARRSRGTRVGTEGSSSRSAPWSDLILTGRIRSDDYDSRVRTAARPHAQRSKPMERRSRGPGSRRASTGRSRTTAATWAASAASRRRRTATRAGRPFRLANGWSVHADGSAFGGGVERHAAPGAPGRARLELQLPRRRASASARLHLRHCVAAWRVSATPAGDRLPTLLDRDHAIETSLRFESREVARGQALPPIRARDDRATTTRPVCRR